MSKSILLLFNLLIPAAFIMAQIPTLGNYPATTVIAGKNTTVSPSAVPTNTSSIVAYTNTNFTGVLSVNPTTGVLRITNAKQAGTYPITIKAFKGVDTALLLSHSLLPIPPVVRVHLPVIQS